MEANNKSVHEERLNGQELVVTASTPAPNPDSKYPSKRKLSDVNQIQDEQNVNSVSFVKQEANNISIGESYFNDQGFLVNPLTPILKDSSNCFLESNPSDGNQFQNQQSMNDKQLENTLNVQHFQEGFDDEDMYEEQDEISLYFDQGTSFLNDTLAKHAEQSYSQFNQTVIKAEQAVSDKNELTEDVIKEPELKKAKLDELILSPVQQHVIQAPRPLPVFISQSKEENDDNNSAGWKAISQFLNPKDGKRYQAVHRLWNNKKIPNVRENLTTYQWRKRNKLNLVPRSISKFDTRGFNLQQPDGECMDIFRRAMQEAKDVYFSKINFLNNWFRGRQRQLVESYYSSSSRFSYNERITQEAIIEKLREIYRRELNLVESSYYERIRRLNEACREVELVFRFYKGLNSKQKGNPLRLTAEEIIGWRQRETIVSSYEEFYQ